MRKKIQEKTKAGKKSKNAPEKLNATEKARIKMNSYIISIGYILCGLAIFLAIVAMGQSIVSKTSVMLPLGLLITIVLFAFGFVLIKLGKKGERHMIKHIGNKIKTRNKKKRK